MRIPMAHRGFGQENTMTPMIDVVFLLLIFFIVASAKQVREAVLPAVLPPGAVESLTAQPAPVRVDRALILLKRAAATRTSAERTIAEMNGTTYGSLDELEQQLKALAEVAAEIPVVLDVAGKVPFGDVARVYDLCRRLRFQTLKFAIQPLPAATPLKR